jgi:Tol biopolymer transport system component
MDFGLARRTATEADSAGTPGYMAPEQLAGSEVDARTDLYALGCLVYEMLAGERVFPGATTTELATQHRSSQPPDLRARRPDVPRWLARAVNDLLAKEPAMRSAGLARLVAGPRTRRVVLPAIALAATVIALFAVWRAFDDNGPASAPAPAWQPRIVDMPAFEELSSSPSFSPDGQLVAFASVREAPGVWRIYVTPTAGGDTRMIAEGGGNPRWTRDGRALLIVDGAHHVVRQPIDGGEPIDLGPGWLADDCGDAIVIMELDETAGYRLILLSADGTRREIVPPAGTDEMSGPRCDRDGQRVLYTRGHAHPITAGSDLYVTDRSGQTRRLTTDANVVVGTFTPDGRSIVFSGRSVEGKINLHVMPADGGPAQQLTYGDGPDVAPDVAADGRSVVFNRTVRSRMAFEGRATATRQLTSRREVLISVTPVRGGRLVVAEREAHEGNWIVAVDIETGAERDLARGRDPFVSIDGTRVFFRSPAAENTLQVVAIDGGAPSVVAVLPAKILGGFDGPDGQHLELATAQAWRIAPDGQPVHEGVAGVVNPAPHGGWRAVQVRAGSRRRIRLVAPGSALDSPGRELVVDSSNNTWLDDRRFSYLAGGALHVLDVITGAELAEHAVRDPDGTSPVLAHDGERWFYSQTVGHVTRHILVNFADRQPGLSGSP